MTSTYIHYSILHVPCVNFRCICLIWALAHEMKYQLYNAYATKFDGRKCKIHREVRETDFFRVQLHEMKCLGVMRLPTRTPFFVLAGWMD